MMILKKQLLFLLAVSTLSGLFAENLHAQQIKLLGQNTLNGAFNGVLLGGATMALQNSNDFKPVQVGLGAGTLYGIGIGFYDVSQINKGQQFYLSGAFNDGRNSSILVLLDTLYGAAGGALIASSLSLILQKPLGDALQYGTGTGAWVGFGFGLIDGLIVAEGPNFASSTASSTIPHVNGVITYSNALDTIELAMISPVLLHKKTLTKTTFKSSIQPALRAVNVNIKF